VAHGYHEETDPEILTWILERFDDNETVTYCMLREEAQRIIRLKKPDFKASAHWANRFVKRHHILLSWEGRCEERLPPTLESKAMSFMMELKRTLTRYQFSRDRIICLDEIPITFSPIRTTSSAQGEVGSDSNRGSSSCSGLRRSSIKNCVATAVVAVLGDGTLLPPMLVVKVSIATNHFVF